MEEREIEKQKTPYQKEYQDTQRKIQRLEAFLSSLDPTASMQWLEMHEHRPLLEQALQDSRERLMIVSPWIRANSVNPWFFQKLEALLRRGVKVYIGYGLGEEEKDLWPEDLEAEKALQKLARQYSKNFTLKRLGDTHAKVLVSDTQFAVTTSFNWLSFRGRRDRTFRDERGTLVSTPQKIDDLFNSLLKQFNKS